MGYLEDLQAQINSRDFSKFWQLWEEYCTCDTADIEEFKEILKAVKASEFAKPLGPLVETAIPLWETIDDSEGSYDVLKLLMDIQTSNSNALADLSLKALKNKYGEKAATSDRLKLVGLRTKENFQGALAQFDLLVHMEKGKFVYHVGGWGVGEIVEVSTIREQAAIEFENITGRKYFTFANAFKNLLPLKDDSFLVRRFADADALEKEARADPLSVIKLLLNDLGPKTASEIKDELCDLVIPESDWSKWWQNARARLKKDTMIDSPESLKEPFRLHKAAVTHEERLHKATGKKRGIADLVQSTYTFLKDNPSALKKGEVVDSIKEKLTKALEDPSIAPLEELQILLFLETQLDHKTPGKEIKDLLSKENNFSAALDAIEIVAFKKRFLNLIRDLKPDWADIFLALLFTPQQSLVRDYLLKELNHGPTKKLLQAKIKNLVEHPIIAPEFLVWYFQKIANKEDQDLPYSDKEGLGTIFEAFLILFSALDSKPEYKDLSKKIYMMLSGKRYALVRAMIQGRSLEFLKEFLLLVAKCQAFSDADLKILRSLAGVVHPTLSPEKGSKKSHFDTHTLWTTEAGYIRTKERMIAISSKEIVANAREVEAARALGDLRENAEYKSALEKRSRLQSELRHLSEQINKARIITKADIHEGEVGVGSRVKIVDSQGKESVYTILGSWDADPDKGILSLQSKFAQAMIGLKPEENFSFKDESYTVLNVESFFEHGNINSK